MEIRQLKYYVGIVDCGSVSRAAQHLFVAQSALSKQISDLEQELGTQLLVRAYSGVRVTESGKIFYEYAQAILKQLNDARAAVHCAPESIVGSVVLGVPQSASAALALPLLQAAREQLPQVSLHLNEELTGNLLAQLKQGRVDLAIFTSNVPLADFEFQPLATEAFFWIRGKHHTASSETGDVTLEEIASQPLILSAAQHAHCIREIIERVFGESGLPLPPLAAEINSVHVLKSAVQAGIAPTILPLALVAQEVDEGRLIAHRIRHAGMCRTLGICWSRELPVTNAKHAVCNLLSNIVKTLCESGRWRGASTLETAPAGLCSDGIAQSMARDADMPLPHCRDTSATR
ncbi:LysR family transcriptional regulator [Paraburkholderia diazotrophica]|uniref:LysR family transcriptional regulator n=1 Tax=Paraburkholderia diazotrophica TaxID=667676 RepID=UPI00317772C2